MIAKSEETERLAGLARRWISGRLRAGRGAARTAGRLTAAVALAATASIILSAAAVPARLVGVTAEGDAVLIESSEPAAYSITRPDPTTIIVDMRNVSVADARSDVPSRGAIAGVRLEQTTAADGRTVARVHLSLTRPSEHTARSSRNTIRIELSPRASAAAAPPQAAAKTVSAAVPPATPLRTAPAPKAAPQPAVQAVELEKKPAGTATVLERIQSKKTASATIVTLSGNGRLAPGTVTESKDQPRRLVMDFPNVTSKAATQTTIDSPLVSRVRVGLNSSQPLVTRVVMEIAGAAKYHVEQSGENGHDLDVVFEQTSAAPAEGISLAPLSPEPIEPEPPITLQQAMANVASITPKEPSAGPEPTVDAMAALRHSVVTPPVPGPQAAQRAQAVQGVPAAAPPAPLLARATPAAAQTQPPTPPQTPPAAPGAGQPSPTPRAGEQQRQFSGHAISLDFEGVDLRAVLRTFADVSGLNMVIDPDVQGTVDIKLTDVPWDQALDVILRGNQLDYTVDGTIVRISKIKTLEDENKARQSAAQAASERAAQAGGLTFETFPLSYAKAADTAPLLKGSLRLSKYGQVQVDNRTNTLIIADLPAQFPAIRELLQSIDRAEPQVEIEARIITTTREFARAIGVQWGLNGRMMPDIGNTTNLAFPNQGTVGGRLGTQGPTGDPRAGGLESTGTVVNLGAPAATSAIGLALGAVNGAFNLDVALSALERTGKGRILSTPRVTTQNNIEAEIMQGVQIPVQTEANNTVTVTFKDAALTLKVTPQITAANTVIMQITVENASPGTLVQGIPSIDTQRAITRVQVSDGATTVMGGIFVSRETSTVDKTPMLYRIPLLGWLFRREDNRDESRELLIFITPRILKG